MTHATTIALVSLLLSIMTAQPDATRQNPLIGTKAPEWDVTHWMNSRPLKLSDLKGKVVLVRWWTGPGCPFCVASAPALNEFYEKYKDDGLFVVGFYHHKSRRPLVPADVKRLADAFRFEFPVAIDPKWRSLNRWWLQSANRDFTSVSFLIDKTGTIRHIHPGGQYVKGDDAYDLMRSEIEKLLAE